MVSFERTRALGLVEALVDIIFKRFLARYEEQKTNADN